MSTWVTAWPAVLAAVGVLVGPGLVVALAAGLRGIPALGLAPALSVTTVAVSAVVAGGVGVPFGIGVVVVGALVLAAGVVGVLVLARVVGLRCPEQRSSGRTSDVAGLTGAVVGGGCAAWAVARGIGRPDVFPQTFDAAFHLNAVWLALRTGNASSLTLGTVAAPGRASGFYPAAWHDVTVLVQQLGGAGVVVSASAVSVVVAGVVWPVGCVLLVRQAVGLRPGTLFAAGVLAAAFGATPHLLLSYGTLWPNALATVLLPAVLACAVTVLRAPPEPRPASGTGGGRDERSAVEELRVADRSLGRFRAGVLAVALLPGVALAHPNAVLSAALLVTVVALVSGWQWVARPRASTARRVAVGLAGLLLVSAQLWLVTRSPLFATTRATSWPARQSLAQAAGEWASSAPVRTPVPWIAAALVLVGWSVAWRRAPLRWLGLAHAAAGAAFVVVAGSDGPVSRALSGPWYDDPFRLAALVGVTAVPLAAVGLGRVVDGALARRVRPEGALVAAAVVLAVLTGGVYAGANSRVVGAWYAGHDLVGPAEESLLRRLPELVPSGTAVAGNPWNGSVLTAPLGDRDFLFPHLQGSWGPDRTLVAGDLSRAAADPAVCPAVRRLHLGYVIAGPASFWRGDRRQAAYRGLDVASAPGFEPVASGGRLTLYRITAC